MKAYKTNSKEWRQAKELLIKMLIESGFVRLDKWSGEPCVRIINNTPSDISLEKLGLGMTYSFTDGLSVWGQGKRYAGKTYSLRQLQEISKVIFLWENKLLSEEETE